MKNKLLSDILVYILSPILVFGFVDEVKIKFFMTALVLGIIAYTVIVKNKEGRLNLTGVVFSLTYILFLSSKQTIQSEYEGYVYNTYFLLICAMSIPILSLFNKNFIKQVYIDILKCKGCSSLSIFNILKKTECPYYFNKMSSLISIHLLSIALVRVYSMYNYGVSGYKTTIDLEILLSVLFVIGELYIISKIANIPKPKADTSGQNKNLKMSSSNPRVINLNQYKNMNK